jgi:hypothetical protein
MAKAYSVTDFLFNREKEPIPFSAGPFRTVPGRPFPIEENAAPVKVVNVEEYAMNQSSFTLVLAATEYNIQGIATMASLVIKARGGDVWLSIYEGQSGLNYTLIANGQAFEVSAVPFGQVTKPVAFFVQSPLAGTVVEIIGMRLF